MYVQIEWPRLYVFWLVHDPYHEIHTSLLDIDGNRNR